MKFETLYLELVNSTDMILTILASLTQEEARVKPDEASWSILETLCHLYDEELEDFREHLDFVLNRQDQKWHPIDPAQWVVDRKYNEQDFKEMKEKFFAERNKSLNWLKSLLNANWDLTYTSEFGTLSAGELLASWVAHDNLAMRQFVELRRNRIEKISGPYSVAYAGDW
jgi:uncharacterized damage-inducible protein DinB